MVGREYVKEELLNLELEKKKTERNYDIKETFLLFGGILTGTIGICTLFGMAALTVPSLTISLTSLLASRKQKEKKKHKIENILKEQQHIYGQFTKGIDGSKIANKKRLGKKNKLEELTQEEKTHYNQSNLVSYMITASLLASTVLTFILPGFSYLVPVALLAAKALSDDGVVRSFRRLNSYRRQERETEREIELLSRITQNTPKKENIKEKIEEDKKEKTLKKDTSNSKEENQLSSTEIPITYHTEQRQKPKQKVKSLK